MHQHLSPRPSKRLADMGVTLDRPPAPVASYVPALINGDLLYVSGQIPVRDGEVMALGAVPGQVPVETAMECARQCAVNGLAAAHAALQTRGGINEVVRVVRVGCWVACEPNFTDQPQIANAASELLIEVFGPFGRHVRAAVGAISLPLNVPVEIEFLFQLRTEQPGVPS